MFSIFFKNIFCFTETNNIIRVVVKSVSFPNSAYNIYTDGSKKNNTFEYSLTNSNYTFTLNDPGFYTLDQIIDLLKTDMQNNADLEGLGGIINITIDNITKKVKFDVQNTNLILHGDIGLLNPFIGNTQASDIITISYIVDSLANLYGLTDAYITSTLIAEQNLCDGDVETHDILCRIIIDVPFAAIQKYESGDDELDSINYRSTRNYDSVDIQLRDLDMNIIELENGPITLLLKVYYL